MMSNAVRYIMLDVISVSLAKGDSLDEIFNRYPKISKEDKEELTKIVRISSK